MSMRAFVALVLLALPAAGQTAEGHLFIVDGQYLPNNPGACPVNQVKEYTPQGTLVGTFISNVGGSGAIRNLTFLPNGDLLVVRGNQILRFDPTGAPLGSFTTTSLSNVQAIAVRPGTSPGAGNVWVASGTSGGVISEFTTAGVLVPPQYTSTTPLLNHPREILFNPDGSRLYIANNLSTTSGAAPGTILEMDVLATPPTFAVFFNLNLNSGSTQLCPIGLGLDITGNIYVVSDYGCAGEIRRIDTTGTASTVFLNFGQGTTVPGLRAPRDFVVDDFLNAYVTCRAENNSIAGIYIFDLTSGALRQSILSSQFCSIIAATFRRETMTVTPSATTVSPGGTLGFAFNAPSRPGRVFAAAASFTQAFGAPGQQIPCNSLVPPFPFPGISFGLAGEPRLLWLNNDSLFQLFTLGFDCPPNGGNPLFCGFFGTLDATGQAAGSLVLPPGPLPVADVSIHVSWVTFDSTAPVRFDLVSLPTCVQFLIQ